jgi:putative tryptophan/tyrosine transport system substrate-binding protein
MDRRAFLTVVAATAGASTAIRRTRAAERVYRVAMMAVHEPFSRIFTGRMRDLGYRLGENFEFELQGSGANMKFELFPAMATAIVSRHPDVIVAAGSEFVVDALRRAAGSTPVVMIFIDFDPLATGQVATFAHPGGTITGLSVQQTDIAGKKIELLHEVAPGARRIGVLYDAATREQLEAAQAAAKNLSIALLPQQLSGATYDYEAAVRTAVAAKAQAVLVLSSGRFFPDRFVIVEVFQKYRLPYLTTTAFADAGSLLCFSVDFPQLYIRAAELVDRILKGQKPADIPVEQPTKLKLIVNVKTAGALGLTIPRSLLLRADEVVQ